MIPLIAFPKTKHNTRDYKENVTKHKIKVKTRRSYKYENYHFRYDTAQVQSIKNLVLVRLGPRCQWHGIFVKTVAVDEFFFTFIQLILGL